MLSISLVTLFGTVFKGVNLGMCLSSRGHGLMMEKI